MRWFASGSDHEGNPTLHRFNLFGSVVCMERDSYGWYAYVWAKDGSFHMNLHPTGGNEAKPRDLDAAKALYLGMVVDACKMFDPATAFRAQHGRKQAEGRMDRKKR